MCYLLKNCCMGCNTVDTTKIKVCKTGTKGVVCTKMTTDDVTPEMLMSCIRQDENECLYFDLEQIMEVVTATNRFPACKCNSRDSTTDSMAD